MKLPRSAAKYKTADYAPLLVNVFAQFNFWKASAAVSLNGASASIHAAYFP